MACICYALQCTMGTELLFQNGMSNLRHRSNVFQAAFSSIVLMLLVTSSSGTRSNDPWPSESILESSSNSALTFTPYTPMRQFDNAGFDPTGNSRSKGPSNQRAPSTFRFGGTKGQFVKMPMWIPTPGRSTDPTRRDPIKPPYSAFTFQFQSYHANGLLLYLDDRGPRDFIELSLHQGTLRLRFKFGDARSEKITAGKKLDDRQWHSVSLEINFPQVILTVDRERVVGRAKGVDASPMTARSFTFLGGIPDLYKLQDLTLPSVYFEARFYGAMRRYAVDGRYKQSIEKLKVIEEEGSDLCYTGVNPCLHNGTCYVSNNKPACDCTATRFQGEFCQNPYDEAAATFKGAQWLAYDVSHLGKPSISSFSDTITLAFKTQQSDGLLLHTGKSADYVTLALKRGGISLVVNLGSGALEVMLHTVEGTFNDNEWHSLKVYRELKQVNLTVDQAHTSAEFTQDDYAQLTLDDVFYIGGSPSSVNLPGQTHANNFIGCLKEVTYRNDAGTILKLSQIANNRDPRMTVKGVIQYSCDDNVGVYGPVTFMTSESYLTMQSWRQAQSGGIKLEFRTTEPHGLLLFGSGDRGDFIAVEMYDGAMYLIINLGSGITKLPSQAPRMLNDGQWHELDLRRTGKMLTIIVDNHKAMFTVKGHSSGLEIGNDLFIGGADFDRMRTLPRYPKGVWTASLRYGFVGCIRSVYQDGVGINLQALASSQTDSQAVIPECNKSGRTACASEPCANSGKCREGWNRYVCDCSATSFRGPACELAVTTAGFNGSQMLQIPMQYTERTQAEEINFRFMTPLSTGLLLTTTSKTTADRLTVQLVKSGQVMLTVDLDCFKKNCTAPSQGQDSIFQGDGLNDNKWHTVKISRHGKKLYLTVDGRIRGTDLKKTHNELQFDTIHMGMVTGQVSSRLNMDRMPTPFAGQLQNVVFNNKPLVDNCFNRQQTCNSNSTYGESKIISNPITFKDKNSYVSIKKLEAYTSMTLYFNLRTTVSDGLILYNAGKGKDFIAVELVSGFVHYVYDLGNGAQIISTPDQSRIDDNEWHDVRIIRDASNTHTLTVDSRKVTHQGIALNRNLDLEGELFVGGVREDMYYNGLPDRVVSRSGFQGCLGTLDFNGVSPQLLGKDMIQSTGTILKGCTGPTSACKNDSCANGGICQQKWDGFTCDCSMTTFVGDTCTQHINTVAGGTAYRFRGDSAIIYEWPSTPVSTRQDNLSVGFATVVRNCVVTRISSTLGSNIRDYLQLEIEQGKLTLRFNIGNNDVVLQEPFPVADGQFHRVRISRKWMNATMRVDNLPERTVAPKGNARSRFAYAASSIPQTVRPNVDAWLRNREAKNTVFNSQSMIQIGGILRENADMEYLSDSVPPMKRTRVERSFRGQMMGFYFNNVRVLYLAAHKSPQVTIWGDAQHIGGPPMKNGDDPTSPTPGPYPFPTTTMATTTIFTTSSTRTSRSTLRNKSGGDECDGQEVCSGASDPKRTNPRKSTPRVSGATKKPGTAATTPTPKSSTPGLDRDEKTYNFEPDVPVREGFDRPPVNGDSYTDTGKLDENATASQTNNSNSGLMNNGNVGVKGGAFGGIFNGTTAMVAGIVGAAVICIIVLLVAIYKYKHKDEHSYRVDERGRNANGGPGTMPNGTINGKKGPIVRKKTGSLTVHGKTLNPRESDKEYYV